MERVASEELAAAAAAEAPRTALHQLQQLSQLLLRLDSEASMEVVELCEDEYQLNSVCVHGHLLQGFGIVTGATDVRRIVEVCKATATPDIATGT